MNRKLHRWTSLPIALFMFVIAVSGVWLQFEEFGKLGGGGPAGADGNADRGMAIVLPTDAEVGAQVSKTLAAARATKPDLTIKKIEIEFGKGAPNVILSDGGRRGPKVEYNVVSGVAKFVPPPPMSMHGLMIQLHTGRIGGIVGLVIVMFASLILVLLSVTGAVVYYQMWRARASSGRKRLFW